MIDDLLVELSDDARASGDTREVKLVETHLSWVLLGREAFKIKKSVQLPFVDFSTPSRRQRVCENELVINRRLAPRTYRDVVPVRRIDGARGPDRFSLHRGEIVDWAVRMRRLDDASRADVLLASGELGHEHVDAIARAIAAFHGEAPTRPDIAACGEPEFIERNVLDNFVALRDSELALVPDDALTEIERWQLSFLRGRRDRLRERVTRGAIKDGHGDLRLEHVFFEEGCDDFEVIDAIEFDDRYRFADVCADVAFIAMDLARSGRVDLAERFVAMYARASNDFELYPLIDFYESYRACVRAKIAALGASSVDAGPSERERAILEGRRYLMLADAAHRRSLLDPVLVVIAGGIASGKSTLAERLGDAMSAPVISADRTRKYMIGVGPTTPAAARPWEGAYVPSFSNEVYSEMFRRASAVLESGRSVVLDASFRTEAMRTAARSVADAHAVRFRLLECVAPEETRRARLVARRGGPSTSDATLEVFDAFSAGWEPLVELCPTEHIRIDTGGSVEASIAEAVHAVSTWPRGLIQ